MNGKVILTLIEQHIEKGIIAVAALTLLAMIWLYGVNTPNKVSFDGSLQGPRELHASVLESARQLETAMRTAKAEEVRNQGSARMLMAAHSEGIFAALSPIEFDATAVKLQPVARTLMTGGREALIPGLTDAEATAGVELVSPLPPGQPVVSCGRSLALRATNQLADSATTLPSDAPLADSSKQAGRPEEVSWASVGAYWDREAQRNEMTAKGYAAYRAKVYVSRIEVERQERLATGEWSEPKLVEGSRAMPEMNIPKPAIDEQGALINKPEVEEAFRLVRAEQRQLIQPAFYTVTAGDEWTLPLEGARAAQPQKVPPGSARDPRQIPEIPSDANDRRVPGLPDDGMDRRAIEEGRRQAKGELRAGRVLMTKQNYAGAAAKFQAVISNPNAAAGDRKQAETELARAQQKLVAAAKPAVSPPIGLGDSLVTHPTRKDLPAVFFHDDTVEAGKTYRYRMRVNLWNRYVGQIKSLKDPAGARQAVLHGEWSLWSEPVTITPETHFFVNGLKPGTDKVSVELWKWIRGKWVKRNVEAGVGDTIGGDFVLKPEERGEGAGSETDQEAATPEPVSFFTGAVVLDIRVEQPVKARISRGKGQFDYNERKSLVLVYLDPADGQVKERTQVFDATDPLRKKLQEQAGDGTG